MLVWVQLGVQCWDSAGDVSK